MTLGTVTVTVSLPGAPVLPVTVTVVPGELPPKASRIQVSPPAGLNTENHVRADNHRAAAAVRLPTPRAS